MHAGSKSELQQASHSSEEYRSPRDDRQRLLAVISGTLQLTDRIPVQHPAVTRYSSAISTADLQL